MGWHQERKRRPHIDPIQNRPLFAGYVLTEKCDNFLDGISCRIRIELNKGSAALRGGIGVAEGRTAAIEVMRGAGVFDGHHVEFELLHHHLLEFGDPFAFTVRILGPVQNKDRGSGDAAMFELGDERRRNRIEGHVRSP